MCFNCINLVQDYISTFNKVQIVNQLFEDLSNSDISYQYALELRDTYLEPKEVIELDTVENIESIEELITVEEIGFDMHEDKEEETQDEDDSLKCDECNQRFENSLELRDHLKSCKPRKFSCSVCAKRFKENRHLIVHMKTHLPDDKKDQVNCNVCGKNYSSVFSLRQHIKVVHVNEAIFTCPYCDKKFSRKANLTSHLNVHSEDKKFECDICGLKLKTKGNLRVHKKIHSEDFVSCTICGKQFKTQNQLTNHKISHSDEKKYSCERCDVAYKRSKELQNHLLSVHFNIKKYECPWCPKNFVNNSNFRKHKKAMHSLELQEYERMLEERIDEEDVIVEEINEN